MEAGRRTEKPELRRTLVMVAGEGAHQEPGRVSLCRHIIVLQEVCPNLVDTFQWLGSHCVPAPSPAQ